MNMKEADWVLRMWRFLDSSKLEKLIVGKERRLWDNTRIDILTQNFAIEVDWVHKWAEAIGQSLYYSAISYKKPGICLLCPNISNRTHDDFNYIYRCNIVAIKHDISVWLIDTNKSIAILPTGERIKI